MARQARNLQNSSIYSIIQKTSEECFRDEKDRNVFLDILKNTQNKYGFQCYAYCLLNNQSFKLIIDTKGSSISQIMQSISISYALYRKLDKKLFTQRFRSKPLTGIDDIIREIATVNQETNSIYNSYCIYNPTIQHQIDWLNPITQQDIVIQTGTKNFVDRKTLQDDFLLWLTEQQLTLENIKKDKTTRNKTIRLFYKHYRCTLSQLGWLFDLTESSVSKILNEKSK